MSRNFELLQRLDRERLGHISESRTRASTSPPDIEPRTYEELNKLVQRLFLSAAASARQVLFTGVTTGVGCTFVTALSAEVLSAQVDSTVCLVQTDANSTDFAEFFSSVAKPSAENGTSCSSMRQLKNNLWASAAVRTTGPSMVPSKIELEGRLLELRREFDYVLMDGMPANSPATLTSASMMDGVVLVLKAGQTRRSAIRLAIEQLENSGAKILGTVLNQREYPIPDAIYKRL